jgi:hypothetical protein
MLKIATCHEWILDLAAQSPAIAGMKLDSIIASTAVLNEHGLNLANCTAHRRLIVEAVDGLLAARPMATEHVSKLLREVIYRNTYGAFAELAAYEWLARCHVRFEPQVPLSNIEVLGANGSTLDGKLFGGPFFDIKAFGFHGRVAVKLQERLQREFLNEQVLISGSWDLALSTFQQLIESAAAIAEQLKSKRVFQLGPLTILLQPRRAVTVTSRVVDPYRLARENARYVFEDAQQFTRNAPFAIVYVIHPWFNAGAVGTDFAGADTMFTRAFARRAFMQFSGDMTPLGNICENVAPGTTIAEASRLLSAIFFINVWPPDADPDAPKRMPSWIYLNPRATHRMTMANVALFRAENINGTLIDDFHDDDY